jgi:hypothetical protein
LLELKRPAVNRGESRLVSTGPTAADEVSRLDMFAQGAITPSS